MLIVSILKTVMNDAPSVPIGDFENEQRNSSVALFQCRDRFPNGPFGERSFNQLGPFGEWTLHTF